MVEALVSIYRQAKTERREVTRALYRSVVEIDNEALIAGFASRVDAATVAMLASAADASFAELPTVDTTLLATVFGTVRDVFERDLPPDEERLVRGQGVTMCNA